MDLDMHVVTCPRLVIQNMNLYLEPTSVDMIMYRLNEIPVVRIGLHTSVHKTLPTLYVCATLRLDCLLSFPV